MKRTRVIALSIVALALTGCLPLAGPPDGGDAAVADVTTGLVAYYPFDGNANDASGYGNHGNGSNVTLAADRNGTANSSYLFNGTNSEIVVPAPNPAPSDLSDWAPNRPVTALTMAAWIELDGLPNTSFKFSPIVMKSSLSGSGANSFMYRMLIGTGLDTISISIDDWNTSSGASGLTFVAEPTSEVWYHVASTWDGTTSRFYLNGALVGEEAFSPTMTRDNLDLVIGADYPGAYESFNGRIDEVRIYDRALTLEQIKALAEAD